MNYLIEYWNVKWFVESFTNDLQWGASKKKQKDPWKIKIFT
jgi:hypothetical protein